ncbi:LysE family transporter [Pelagibacterales bacterium SAG-MED29]|nr:LysE family transporter [Pelagibacterales bacterium SAG-MED29]
MENLMLGFLTGGSLILAIGPQNLFVIEQGLKKNFVFTITTICAASDILLIFLGIFIYHIFDSISFEVEVILNIILIVFLLNYIKDKIGSLKKEYKIKNIERSQNFKNIILKTLGFTYLNPHVYSDTVFILGNLSKNFLLQEKFYFAFGASFASIIFFYSLGYMSSAFANFIKKKNTWKYINSFIIFFMSILAVYIAYDTFIHILIATRV